MAQSRCPVHDRIVKTAREDAYSVHGHADCPLCKKANTPEFQEMVKNLDAPEVDPYPTEGQPGDNAKGSETEKVVE